MIDHHQSDFGLASGELRLVPVGSVWASRFSAERDRIAAALGAAALDIQHIGSTAVPGILAKPILDIAVAIQSFEDGQSLVPMLVSLGYEYRGENGIARRHYFVQGSPRRSHHLHMLEKHSAELAMHLRFRNHLLASPAMAARYSELKSMLAKQFEAAPSAQEKQNMAGNRDWYQSEKSAFIVKLAKQ